jgi:two-component system alkaline phosphatase synthesis response regulator PhoP
MERGTGQAAVFCQLFENFVNQQEVFRARDIRLDGRSGRVWVEGRAISDLTPAEFTLLSYLFERRGEVCSRDELEALYPGKSQNVDTLMDQLRGKIESAPRRPRYVITVRGRGFKLAGATPERS